MSWLRLALKGPPGHPAHPPLTDVTIGALTVGSIATVLGWMDIAVDLLGPAAYASLLFGLIAAVPTAITGLADLLDIPAGTPAQTTAIIHMAVMAIAVPVFLVALLILGPTGDEVPTGAAIAATGGLVLLAVGGWVGGSLVFGHALRVDGDEETPTRDVLRPRRPT